MEIVDGQEIMGYELLFGMIFGAEHLESSEEGNQDDAEHARLDHNNMDDGENSAAESLPGAQNMKNLKGFNRSANRTKKKIPGNDDLLPSVVCKLFDLSTFIRDRCKFCTTLSCLSLILD